MDSNKKVTRKDCFNAIREILVNEGAAAELIEFVDHQVELLSKERTRGLTQTQKDNLELVEVVYEVLNANEGAMNIGEIIAADERLAGFTSNKVVALLKKLVDADRVVKTKEGKKVYYSVAE